MHPCLSVDEILRLLARTLAASKANTTIVVLACCCKIFEEPMLDELWRAQGRLTPLLKCFPQDVWIGEGQTFVSPLTTLFPVFSGLIFEKSFKRIPTKEEWAHSRKYALRMQKLTVDFSEEPVTPNVALVLQLRTINDPWLPRLQTLECKKVTEAFSPFIPLFLSPKTTEIDIEFARGIPTVVGASMIARLSTLCPDLECITLNSLPRDLSITEAVSEMLLACNRDTLQAFRVDSPLTEEAREVVYRLPRLSDLWVVIQGPTSLPTMALPNLTSIDVEFDDYFDWLPGFRGATLEKLESVTFRSESEKIGDFLKAFESVALAASAHDTLSVFNFFTSRSWNPNYSSLLSFNQLKEVRIYVSCEGVCSSRVDDDIIMDMARAMPKLEVLQLGDTPCETPTGITVNGLIGLACLCPYLSKLCIHFQATSLVEAASSAVTLSPSGDEPVDQWEDCALTDLEVGKIRIPARSGFTVALILLRIFPHILNIKWTNLEWKTVAETIQNFGRIGTFVHRLGIARPSRI